LSLDLLRPLRRKFGGYGRKGGGEEEKRERERREDSFLEQSHFAAGFHDW